MSTFHDIGAAAPGLVAPKRATKNEAPGWQARGFRGQRAAENRGFTAHPGHVRMPAAASMTAVSGVQS